MADPKDLSECYPRAEFNTFERALNRRLDHMASDQHRDREGVQREIQHKYGTLRQMIIWVGAVSFGVAGWLWNELSKISDGLAEHSHSAHDIAAEQVKSLMCAVHGVCV